MINYQKLVFFLFTLFVVPCALAQVMPQQTFHLIDSLEQELLLARANGDLESEVILVSEICQYFQISRQATPIIEYGLRNLELAGVLNRDDIAAKMNALLSGAYKHTGEMDSALHFANRLLIQSFSYEAKGTSPNDSIELNIKLKAYTLMSKIQLRMGDYTSAEQTIDSAVVLVKSRIEQDVFDDIGDMTLGHVYEMKGRMVNVSKGTIEAFSFYSKYLEEARRVNDLRAINTGLFYEARLLGSKRKPEEAIALVDQIDLDYMDPGAFIAPWGVLFLKASILHRLERFEAKRNAVYRSYEEVSKTDYYDEIIRMLNIYYGDIWRGEHDHNWELHLLEELLSYQTFRADNKEIRNIGRFEVEIAHQKEQSNLSLKLAGQRNMKWFIAMGAMALLIINIVLFRYFKVAKRARALNEVENEKLTIANELAAEKKERLESILDYKRRQLATTVISTNRMNSNLEDIADKLKEVKDNSEDAPRLIDRLLREITTSVKSQDDWAQFYKHFEGVHPDFFGKLLRVNSELNNNDLRHAAYMLMNLSNKEVASMHNISPDSCKTARKRLKKRLNLLPEASLQSFINSLSADPSGILMRG